MKYALNSITNVNMKLIFSEVSPANKTVESMSLTIARTPSELIDFANRMGEKPELFSLRTTAETCSRNQAPFLKLNAAFAVTEKATYFFLSIDFEGKSQKTCDLYSGFTGHFDAYDFREAAAEFLNLFGFLQNPRSFITYGCAFTAGIMTDLIITMFPRSKITDLSPCYLINEGMIPVEEVMKIPVDVLPEGYTYDVLNPSEAVQIADQWACFQPGADELMTHYIKHMPNVAIRYHGKLAAFQMRSESGMGSHLWVDPKHRGQQLYKAILRELSRKTIRFGMRHPHSYIVHTNHNMAKLVEDRFFCKTENGDRMLVYWTTINIDNKAKQMSKL